MCRGREEKEKTGVDLVSCELCNSEASLYCQADDAFLCKKCDSFVHAANFLAQRHIRCLLCTTCQSLTRRYLVGTSVEVVLPTVVCLKGKGSGFDQNLEEKDARNWKEPFLLL
ncbi:B-box type zinc finger family protein [Forsythia ovata]|uniref:B-box type zinc finger family protein n=1 Tax=Forsythia ovata TaxID=205694 RepID=A0ABD1QD95_9LAMI